MDVMIKLKTMTFLHEEGQPFSAYRKAEKYLKDAGYSIGRMAYPCPIGFKKGNYDISKWWNLTPEEQKSLDGIISFSEDFREGDVTIKFYQKGE